MAVELGLSRVSGDSAQSARCNLHRNPASRTASECPQSYGDLRGRTTLDCGSRREHHQAEPLEPPSDALAKLYFLR